MEFFDVVTTLRAIRRLRPDPIPDAVLRQILDAAICAPSGGNRQGWSFLVVRDPARRAGLGAIYRGCFDELLKVPFYRDAAAAPPDAPEARVLASARHLAEHLGEAPVIVLACIPGDATRASLIAGASIYPAVQNILLAARALGVGSCLTTIHRYREAEVRALLGIPGDVEVAALVPLGWPVTRFGRPPRRPLGEVTFADRWGQPTGW